MKHLLSSLVGLLPCFCVGTAAMAQQSYPSKAITIVVPSSPGSPSDMIGRLIGKSIAAQTNAAVVTEDKPGANGIIGVQQVLNTRRTGIRCYSRPCPPWR